MTRVLVVAAHPDDEVLGCGGAMARHVRQGDQVAVLILGRGLGARGEAENAALSQLERDSRAALAELGVTDVRYEDFPDNRFDTVPLLAVAQAVEKVKAELRPERVYTHAAQDLNIDHRICFDAVMAAFRPQPGEPCREILTFEVMSATHWRAEEFRPTVFMDIADVLDRKLAALARYDSEMRPWPHARSVEAARVQAQWRGALVGVAAAECFVPARMVM